jgi:hypothetical protein
MDTYRINTYDLWYCIIYPFIFLIICIIIALNIGIFGFTSIIQPEPPGLLSIPQPKSPLAPYTSIFTNFGYFTLGIVIYLIIKWGYRYSKSNSSFGLNNSSNSNSLSAILDDFIVKIWLFSFIPFVIFYVIVVITSSYTSTYTINSKTYEHFNNAATPSTDTANISKTLTAVEQVTESLRDSLDILDTATDDTCTVIKGIEQKFIDNATSPSGDGDPPSKEEAAKIKAKKLPGATKQWNRKMQDWADTHGQIPIIECFTDGSLSDLVDANQQLKDLLASAPVQRVVAQVKRLQTSELFAQKYMNDLANELTKQSEGFINLTSPPTSEDTIATSNKLIQQAKDVQAQIKNILASTSELKKNYSALNTKANDPNTVSNLAAA